MAEYVEPEAEYTSRVFGLTTGLAGTVRFRLIDNDTTADDPVYGPSTADIVEDPAGSGSYVFTGGVAPATEGKFSRVWDEGAATELVADEDMIVLSGITSLIALSGDTYGNSTEMFRRLKIRNPTADQSDAADLFLLIATTEINDEIDLAEDVELSDGHTAICIGVCYDRAIELWNESPFGLIAGLEDSGFATRTSQNTWNRYAHRLANVKNQWGFA